MTFSPVRLGVVGLGRAFTLMLPAFRADPRIELVAACAPRQASREAFAAEFGGATYSDIEALCADASVEVVYIATPHQLHREHVVAAANSGKHVLVDKPLSILLEDGMAMVEVCREAGVHLIVGPSHSFDGPVAQARGIINSGALGRVRMIQAVNYTDFLYRPRRPEELRTEEGGGVIFSQGVHQIDIVRLLAGGLAREVTAMTGNWDPGRATEGAYAALVSFAGGSFATLTYSGYAHFDTDEWMGWVGELGVKKNPENYGAARRALKNVASQDEEAELKTKRAYGPAMASQQAEHHEHFGPIVVLCDRGDLRVTPQGVHVYGDYKKTFHPAPALRYPRAEVIDALVGALREDQSPVQTGEWGLASLEVCHAILRSAETGGTTSLNHQVAATSKEQ